MRIEILRSYQSANERGERLLNYVIITVKDLDRSIAFYETALKPLGSVHALDYDPRYYAANVFDPDGYNFRAGSAPLAVDN